jgi:hypothetical protein
MRMLMRFGVINFLEWSSAQFSMPSIRICSHYLCFLPFCRLKLELEFSHSRLPCDLRSGIEGARNC